MFDYLRKGFYLLIFVFSCALFSASALFSATNTQTISSATASAGITATDANFTGADLTRYGTGEKSGLAVNNITINYNGADVNGLSTVGTVNMENNTLNLTGGAMTLAGDHIAARLNINNGTSSTNANLSNFNLLLKNNVLDVTAKIDNSVGNLYGAVLVSSQSGVGNAQVTGNQINVGAAANFSGAKPTMTAGMMQISSTINDIITDAVVSSNTVVVNANSTNEFGGDIAGGKVVLNVNEQATHKTYNVTANIDGNRVSLNNAKFYGNMNGGKFVVYTGAEYNTMTLSGDVQNNEIHVGSGKYNGNTFIGGQVSLEGRGLGKSSTAAVNVHDNLIEITGGQFTDTIFVGGMATRNVQYTTEPSGTISNNTIEISGTPTFSGGLYLFGGYTTGDDANISNNTLSLKTSGITAYGVDYFDTYKFDVSSASAGDTFLSVRRGNGHNNNLFIQYESYVKNSAIDLSGVNFTWKDTTAAEDGRPSALGVGDTITLLTETSGLGLKGTIANNGVEESVVVGSDTYYYKVLQIGNKVELLHNGFNTTGNYTGAVSVTAGANPGEDVYMHVDSGTITAPTISVTSTASSVATLTAQTLDVTAQNTALTLNNTSGDKVKFGTINVGGGYTLTKAGNGFYSFDTLNITGTDVVNSLDAFNGATSAVNISSGSNNFDTINVGSGTTLNITGTYDFNTLGVYGDGNTFTGDLNAANKNLNFFLADTTTTADTALNVTGAADIADSNVQVGITGSSSPLKKGDEVVLLQGTSLSGTPVNTTGVGMQGLFLAYDFDLNTSANQLVATVTKAGLQQEAKAFSEGRVASIGLISQGADFVAETGITSAANAAWNQGKLAMFTAFGGGKTRLDSGSHVDLTSYNALVGLSREVSIFKADFVVGSFAEYGHGDYKSYNEFASGDVKGSGDTEYTGIGALARWYGQDGSYVEGVLHAGIVSTDFSGHVFSANKTAKYDFDSWYYGGHFGVGKKWNLFDEFDATVEPDTVQIDTSVKYFLNHQEADDASVSSGDKIDFYEANSSRLRAGLKLNFFASDMWRPYIGVAYDHEFSGKAKASSYNMSIDAPSIEGSTGTGEIGLSYVRKGFTFGVGGEGYVGVRKGWSGNVKVGFTF